MKVVSRYCDSCGTKIPPSDIQDGTALKFEESYYCKDCKGEILPLIDKAKTKPGGPDSGSGPAAGAFAGRSAKGTVGGTPLRIAAKKLPPGARTPGAGGTAGKVGSGASARGGLGGAAGRVGTGKLGSGSGSSSGAARLGTGRVGSAGKLGRGPLVARRGAPTPRPMDDDGDAEGGFEDDGAAFDDYAAKKGLPWLWIGVGAAAIAVAVAGYFLLAGGPKDGASTVAQADQPVKKNQFELAEEKYKKLWASAEEFEKQNPTEYDAVIRKWDSIRDELRGDWQDKCDEKLADSREDKNQAARAAFEDSNARVDAKIGAGDLEGALGVLDEFPKSFRDTGWFISNVQALREQVRKQMAARDEAEPLIERARHYATGDAAAGRDPDLALAAGVLYGFDKDKYSDSPYAVEVSKLIGDFEKLQAEVDQKGAIDAIETKRIQAELAAAEAERKRIAEENKRIATLQWESLMYGDAFGYQLPAPMGEGVGGKKAWDLTGLPKELRGETGGNEIPQAAGQGIAAVIGTGKPDWQDYIVEFKYKLDRGSFWVGVRCTAQMSFVELKPDVKADGQWHTMQISVRGDKFLQIEDGNETVITSPGASDSYSGGVGFALGTNTKAAFSEIRIKVINKTGR